MSQLLEIRDVSMVFSSYDGKDIVTALKDINFDFKDGEFVVALGASGCGKTTLLNLLAGFLQPSKGSIKLHGETIQGPGKDRGVVFQKHALLPWLNVIDNTAFGLKLQGVDRKTRLEEARRNLELVNLQDFLRHPVYKLSGGMQQRVGLARALTSNPSIMLMDEPLGALDAFTRENIQELLIKVWKKTGKMIFFITHSVEEALFLATRLVIMSPRPGRITHTYDLEFCHEFLKGTNARDIKSSAEFIKIREEVLSIIHGEEVDEITKASKEAHVYQA